MKNKNLLKIFLFMAKKCHFDTVDMNDLICLMQDYCNEGYDFNNDNRCDYVTMDELYEFLDEYEK